ncbi:vWA domain-containing protein [Paraliomyxa miuraensis]|uniref:vWA domain-containing protein n=1 Tax=Paraliomyxa miuraensis TaxID=376150 RepID=UPI0022527786|nr:hypothetical protein [Paraliomyxa miuraensis]MCX4241483.1 hypothetical protein [Paraliomyxa miuraensis]
MDGNADGRGSMPSTGLVLGAGLVSVLLGCGGDGGRADDSGPTSLTGITITATATDGDPTETSAASVDGTADGTGGGGPCETDDDCPAGQHCGAMSKQCLGPIDCVLDNDCDEGFTCEEGMCTIGGGCGGFVFSFDEVPPNLLILLDRSGSMDGDVPGTGMNRWEVAREAIFGVTTQFNDAIDFGLATYSSCLPGGCSPGDIVVPILPVNAPLIQSFLDNTAGQGSLNGQAMNPDGTIRYLCDSGNPETSTGVSLDALVGEPSLQDPTRTNAVLLLTDGGESSECTGSVNGPAGAANLLNQAVPVQTFAVGMGGASLSQLEQIAMAGGTGQPYFADQPADLQMAMAAIASSVTSCTFQLTEVPPNANEIYVFFDDDPAGVPNDPANGWTYDSTTNTIIFHGAACQAIQDGSVVGIDIVYGCNMPPVG